MTVQVEHQPYRRKQQEDDGEVTIPDTGTNSNETAPTRAVPAFSKTHSPADYLRETICESIFPVVFFVVTE